MKIRIVISILATAIFLTSCTTKSYNINTQSETNIISDITCETDNTVAGTIVKTPEVTTKNKLESFETTSSTSAPMIETSVSKVTVTTTSLPEVNDDMVVHFIDVGQGDSIFIELPNSETMLIDAGEISQGDLVSTYILSQGYDTIDHVVATHSHNDHIGGMIEVLDTFKIGTFYMTEAVSTSSILEQALNKVAESDADTHYVIAGDVIVDCSELLCEVVAPKAIDNDEMNNNSIVIKLTYGETKFLFTGDAEKSEEDGIWTNIKCDVLKVGHHGSANSSTSNFLKKVEPKYAIISCGLGNSYGHPTDEVLKRLYDNNIDVFRTDLQGTIVFTSDGKNISVNKKPLEYTPVITTTTAITTVQVQEKQQSRDITYVLNTNTKKIHYESCSSVDQIKDKNKAYTDDYDSAIAQGYKPCGRCNP